MYTNIHTNKTRHTYRYRYGYKCRYVNIYIYIYIQYMYINICAVSNGFVCLCTYIVYVYYRFLIHMCLYICVLYIPHTYVLIHMYIIDSPYICAYTYVYKPIRHGTYTRRRAFLCGVVNLVIYVVVHTNKTRHTYP